MRNLLLSCIVIFFSASAFSCADAGPPPDKDVIVQALAVQGALILDVRSSSEYAERMPAIAPDKGQQIVVYCAKGVRAAKAESTLREMGYTKILNAKTPGAVAKAMGKDLVK